MKKLLKNSHPKNFPLTIAVLFFLLTGGVFLVNNIQNRQDIRQRADTTTPTPTPSISTTPTITTTTTPAPTITTTSTPIPTTISTPTPTPTTTSTPTPTPTATPVSSVKKGLSDLNDDDKVNQIDYNLFLREIGTQVGE